MIGVQDILQRFVTLRAVPKRRIVRRVVPNAGVRAWYDAQLTQLIIEMYLDFTRVIGGVYVAETAKIDAKPSAASTIATDAGITRLDAEMRGWGKRWVKKFDKLSLSMSKDFTTRAFGATQTNMKDAFKQAGFTVKFKPSRGSLEAYKAVASEQVNLIKSIPQKYLTDVQSAVWSSVRVGGDMRALSATLRKQYGVTVGRAALISRDQNAKATAVIENTRRQELGIDKAIWEHSNAGKEPRPSHLAMDGKVFDLKKGMWDPDEGEWVFPGQLINCRCGSRAIIEEFGE